MVERSFSKSARGLTAALLLVLGAFFALVLLHASTGASMIDDTLEHSRELESDFREAARFVEGFRAQRGRLPNKDELEKWSEHRFRLTPFIVDTRGGYTWREALAAFGSPPRGGFILAIWRGEWMEYYASWSGMTTMPSDESAYYFFGSRAADRTISGLCLLICFAAALGLWKGRGRGADQLRV